jgi:hypothetical protein
VLSRFSCTNSFKFLLFRYYEEKIVRSEDHAHQEMEEVINRARTSAEESKAMEATVAVLFKDKAKAEQKMGQMASKLGKLTSELKEEKCMNESLRKNQCEWQEALAKMDAKMKADEEEKDTKINDLQVIRIYSAMSSSSNINVLLSISGANARSHVLPRGAEHDCELPDERGAEGGRGDRRRGRQVPGRGDAEVVERGKEEEGEIIRGSCKSENA